MFIQQITLELLIVNIDMFISAVRFCAAINIGVLHITG